MGWLANQAEKADIRVGTICLDFLKQSFPELHPRFSRVNCMESDKSGQRYTHWAVTLTNSEGKVYFFHRCRLEWKLTMSPDDFWEKRIREVSQNDLLDDCKFLAAIAIQNAEDAFTIF